jgi:hypothetical protein
VIHKDKEWLWEVQGSRSGSTFFGLNDVSDAMMQLVFKSDRAAWSLRTKYSSTVWETRFGAVLQAPRRIAPIGDIAGRHRSRGARPLEDFATRISRCAVFVSWKHCDHNRQRRRFMRSLVDELRKRGLAVWWDKTSLTDVDAVNAYSLVEKNELMHKLLRQGLSKSMCILAVWTENYGVSSTANAPNWTRDEWQTRIRPPKSPLSSMENY